MLFALMLLGLLPASLMVTPNTSADDGGDADDFGRSTPVPEAPPSTDMLFPPDEVVPPAEEFDTETEPADITIDPDIRDTFLTGFRPGIDHLTITLGEGEHYFEAEAPPYPGATELTIWDDAGNDRSIIFDGLDELPTSDITLVRIDPETGEEIAYTLASPSETSAPLMPEAGDLPEVITPAEGDDGGILPSDGELPEVVTPGEGEAGLQPQPGDVPEQITPAGQEPLSANTLSDTTEATDGQSDEKAA